MMRRLTTMLVSLLVLGLWVGAAPAVEKVKLQLLADGLVRGSHGRLSDTPAAGPVLLSSEPGLVPEGAVRAADVKPLLLSHVFGSPA